MKVIKKERDEGFLKTFEAVCKKYGAVPVLEWKFVNPQCIIASMSYEKDTDAGPEETDRFNKFYEKISGGEDVIPAYGDSLCEVFQNLIKDVSAIWDWSLNEKLGESFSHKDLIEIFGEENEGNFYRMRYM